MAHLPVLPGPGDKYTVAEIEFIEVEEAATLPVPPAAVKIGSHIALAVARGDALRPLYDSERSAEIL